MNAKLSFTLATALVAAAAQAQPPVKPAELPPLTLTPPESPKAAPPEAKYNPEAAKAFATKIQPILTNCCANCHAHKGHTSDFKLKWIEPGLNDPQSADQNLRAAAKWLTPANPHSSPLLAYSTTAHGKAAEAPLPAKHAGYKQLELWVHWACGPDGSAAPTAVPPPPAPAAAIPTPVQPAAASQPSATQPIAAPPAVVPAGGFAATPSESKVDAKPNPSDPFDPATFNRAAHPNRK